MEVEISDGGLLSEGNSTEEQDNIKDSEIQVRRGIFEFLAGEIPTVRSPRGGECGAWLRKSC